MYDSIEVNARIAMRHPEISEDDVKSAWANALVIVERTTASFPDVVLVAVGADANGRLLEIVGTALEDGTVHVFHAMTPPSRKTLRETGIRR